MDKTKQKVMVFYRYNIKTEMVNTCILSPLVFPIYLFYYDHYVKLRLNYHYIIKCSKFSPESSIKSVQRSKVTTDWTLKLTFRSLEILEVSIKQLEFVEVEI